jgi:hypothetical protein
MLSSVLKSKKAVAVNIAIIRTFTLLRKILLQHKDVINELIKIKKQISEHDQNILLIFDYLKQVEESKQQQQEQTKRKRIGYKLQEKE